MIRTKLEPVFSDEIILAEPVFRIWGTHKGNPIIYASASINTFTVKSIILLEEIFLEKLLFNQCCWRLLLSAVRAASVGCLSSTAVHLPPWSNSPVKACSGSLSSWKTDHGPRRWYVTAEQPCRL